jgi:hypothetical protein
MFNISETTSWELHCRHRHNLGGGDKWSSIILSNWEYIFGYWIEKGQIKKLGWYCGGRCVCVCVCVRARVCVCIKLYYEMFQTNLLSVSSLTPLQIKFPNTHGRVWE